MTVVTVVLGCTATLPGAVAEVAVRAPVVVTAPPGREGDPTLTVRERASAATALLTALAIATAPD